MFLLSLLKQVRNRTVELSISHQLQELKGKVTDKEVCAVAVKLDISRSTVYVYLGGNVAKGSRGKLILKELNSQISKR